ncbi:DUF947-domain-containing protein [Polychaeton citri CBS 116435]|uniref:rRNA biogenesis protein RRP36 n=1 Tax=Polychaeton citri CBS 116435 TaxID=1314669 RepID=A0A9P4PXB6_9PEZI|nr:DUF947-domain-containing protein [Polychaeton citri CBS 116435]
MAPAQRNLLERNVEPRRRTFDESEDSDDAFGSQQSQLSSEDREEVEQEASNSDSSSISEYSNDDGKRIQTSRDSRAKLQLRSEQDAEPGSRRGLDESESEMEELDGWRSGSGGSGDEERENDNVQRGLDQVSFGALKKAQDSLASKSDGRGKKRRRESGGEVDEALQKLRKQIKDKESDLSRLAVTKDDNPVVKVAYVKQGHSDDEGDSDSAPSEEAAPASRASKHAPMSQTSKRQVTRKRQVIDVPRIQSRDPRFDAVNSVSTHPSAYTQKAYGFLDDYQKAEIAELKIGLRKAKTTEDKETLRRKIVATENKLKAKAMKEREQDVIRRHRKEEKEKIQQGKKPYFLKHSELKERALVERFKGMKGKEREKVIEKRRRKEGQKEKKRMPMLRRSIGDA